MTYGLTITPEGLDAIDVLEYVEDTTDIEITFERERSRFEFVVDDVSLRLSNISSGLEDIFRTMKKSSVWRVEFWIDGVRRFAGFIEPSSVDIDANEDWITLNCFSLTRAFWDRCEKVLARPRYSAPPLGNFGDFGTLTGLMNRELIAIHGLNRGGVFFSIDLGEFASRPVNYANNPVSAQFPLEGRYRDLDPQMSWADLLKEMAKYYNAEFYVDPETLNLTMRRRNAAVRKERNLDRYVQEDEAPKITLADSDVVDWISTSHLVRPDPPSLNRVEWGTTDTPLYNNNEGGWYKILCIGEGNLIIFASEAVYLNNTMGAPGGQQNRSWLYVNVPVGPPGTVRRDLYRLPDQIQGAITYYLIARVAGNTAEAVVEDPFGPAWLYNNPAHGEMPPVPAEAEGPRTVYYRMNEDTNAWEVLVEGVQASPTGNILDVWPSLAFTPHNMSGDASESQRATMIFFGNEINAELVRSAYAEMFATRRKITFRAKGMDYRIGDEIFFYNDSRFAKYGTMLIKRVAIRPLEETTHITAFTYGWL